MHGILTSNSTHQLLARARVMLGEERGVHRASLEEVADLLRDIKSRIEPEVVIGGLASWQLRRVAEHVEKEIDRSVTVAELAVIARLSVRHFARAFARSKGVPPHAYIVSRRVAAAKRIMRDTEMPLSEIALACGACDQAHLSRLFRAACGISPMQWRRANCAGPHTKSL